jgi:hypothetical protein
VDWDELIFGKFVEERPFMAGKPFTELQPRPKGLTGKKY